MGRVHLKSAVSGSPKGFSPLTSTLTVWRVRRLASTPAFSSGLKTMPPAHSERIQSTERSGPLHTSDRRPRGAQHASDLGHRSGLVDPVPRRRRDDHVLRRVRRGKGLGCAVPYVDPGVPRREDGPHALVRLDGRDMSNSLGEQGGEEPGARPDLEGIGGTRGNQPVERVGRGPGPEPVVLLGDRTEGLAQHRSRLVLAHMLESTEGELSSSLRVSQAKRSRREG